MPTKKKKGGAYRYWVSDPLAPEGEEAKIEERSLIVPRSAPILNNPRRNRPPLQAGKRTNPWLIHLAKYRTQNPNLSLKEAMKKARSTYKK